MTNIAKFFIDFADEKKTELSKKIVSRKISMNTVIAADSLKQFPDNKLFEKRVKGKIDRGFYTQEQIVEAKSYL